MLVTLVFFRFIVNEYGLPQLTNTGLNPPQYWIFALFQPVKLTVSVITESR